MADDIDLSSEIQQERLQKQIDDQLARGQSAPKLKPNGTCYNPLCADDVAEGKLFCSADCARKYQTYEGR